MTKENKTMDKGAIGFAIAGLLLVIAGMASPNWLRYTGLVENGFIKDQAFVGLWKAEFIQPGPPNELFDYFTELKFSDGKAEDPNYDWYFGSWMNACRALAILTILWGAGTIALHFWKSFKTQNYFWSKIVFFNYIITSLFGTCAAGTWVGSIAAQELVQNADGVEEYIWRGDYGAGLWIFWIGTGFFLPAAALAFEGGFVNHKSEQYKKLEEEFNKKIQQ
ncbi:Oidioi.mRNA.OKI2018_I69.PAR.g9586.t1.cds [Oikopleura dioica]|uniref:Oidioi.mRNA.OKI2018_I69.PAR.g9586.t1.cds n=1 Tax=Oikopleura dioica TaxID=34765 RepID=A0ABN7RLA8_OIKDI|nr:Oidioi.mRNA.OKI2018_I69.PAR.g9586.t1.cds [Oikopleura dioica]